MQIVDDYDDGQVLVDDVGGLQLQQHHAAAPPILHSHPHVLNPNVPNFTVLPAAPPPEVIPVPHFGQPPPDFTPAQQQQQVIVTPLPPPPPSSSSLSPVGYEPFVPAAAKQFAIDQPPPQLPAPPPQPQQIELTETIEIPTPQHYQSQPAAVYHVPSPPRPLQMHQEAAASLPPQVMAESGGMVVVSPQQVAPINVNSTAPLANHHHAVILTNTVAPQAPQPQHQPQPILNSNNNNQNVPNVVNTSKEEAAAVPVNKQQVVKQAEKMTTVKTDRFGGANNKPVAWNKKQTTSVSVSAIPAKETPPPAAPQQAPKVQNLAAAALAAKYSSPPPPIFKVDSMPKERIEVKRENKEVTASVAATKSAPMALSLAPPPPPIEEQKAAPTISWASLFQSSAPPKPPVNPGADASPAVAKRPIAKVLPFEGTATNQAAANAAAATAASSGGGGASAVAVANKPEKKPIADEYSLKLADFLMKYKIDNNSISIFPRGLINRSNYCYINAILQALVSCPPFYHLMRDMPKPLPVYKAKGSTPIIDAMQELMFDFSPRKIIKEKGATVELVTDQAFEPTIIYKMLAGIRSEIFQVEGRQEDAEEFLGCILNRLNDEMLEVGVYCSLFFNFLLNLLSRPSNFLGRSANLFSLSFY